MTFRKAVLLGAAFVLATACGTTEPAPDANGTAPPPVATGDPGNEFVTGLYDFAERFGEAVAAPDANTVYSPLSIAYAFAMLRAGADGETAAQLDEVFSFPAERLGEAVQAVTAETVTIDDAPPRTDPDETRGPEDEPQEPVVAIANGLFVQDGVALEPSFTNALADDYDAQAVDVDFRSPDAIETIDAWVDEHTAGRITRLFDDLDPETIAVIANAIYMKAEWQYQFSESSTEDAEFTKADGSTVTVPMMSKQALSLRHVTGETWNAIELPYVGGELAMWVLVSEGEEPLAPTLTSAVFEQLRDGAPAVSANVALPRWDYENQIDLLERLGELGLTNLAELDGITPEFMVSDAIHRANITVDERGTEAAAVTGVAGVTSLPAEPQIDFRADRPFSFVVMHTPTGAPLFAGSVADPIAD